MIRGLKNERYAFDSAKASKDKVNGFSELSGFPDAAEDEETVSAEKYNYKTVASRIQRAKTSISAGQAVLAAKRETLKIKRKMSSGNGDPEELLAALTHAKRMEMAARKKQWCHRDITCSVVCNATGDGSGCFIPADFISIF